MSETTDVSTYVAEHPKMTGALFTLVLLLSQGVSLVSAGGAANPGP